MAEESQIAKDRQTGPPRGTRRGLSLEVVGEIVLLVIVGGLFAYLFIESFTWPPGSALMPRITVAIGTPFWLWRLASLIRSSQKVSSEQIMDLGFRTGADPRGERIRFFRICACILGLYVAIWLIGFHIAIPLGVAVYVYAYGRKLQEAGVLGNHTDMLTETAFVKLAWLLSNKKDVKKLIGKNLRGEISKTTDTSFL